MDRNLALEFVRVTEAAAIAASKWIGKGDAKRADGAAVDEMRDRFNQIDFAGRVVIGEGSKDEAPELYTGEKVGTLRHRSGRSAGPREPLGRESRVGSAMRSTRAGGHSIRIGPVG